jgi:hypothetical protein
VGLKKQMSSIGDWRITPRRSLSELPKDITLDLKIDIFRERIEGWKLDIADQLINGIKDEKGNTITEGNPNAGYVNPKSLQHNLYCRMIT